MKHNNFLIYLICPVRTDEWQRRQIMVWCDGNDF